MHADLILGNPIRIGDKSSEKINPAQRRLFYRLMNVFIFEATFSGRVIGGACPRRSRGHLAGATAQQSSFVGGSTGDVTRTVGASNHHIRRKLIARLNEREQTNILNPLARRGETDGGDCLKYLGPFAMPFVTNA
jgi:hypothetical protein